MHVALLGVGIIFFMAMNIAGMMLAYYRGRSDSSTDTMLSMLEAEDEMFSEIINKKKKGKKNATKGRATSNG